jgi:hypothetical protein
MLFRVIEHYDDLPQPEEIISISIESKNECLLCLEMNTDDKLTPVDLKTQHVYLKVCNCGGWFHITCLHQWYDVSNSCPICRIYMKKRYDYDYDVKHFVWTIVVFFVHFCNIFWFFFVWGVVGVLGSYNVYLTYAS